MIPFKKYPLLLSLPLSLIFFSSFGCAALKQQLEQMAAFTKCQFRMVSVEKVNLSGIPLQGLARVSDIDVLDLIKLRSVFTSGSLPLKFTLNLEVKNPNSSSAGMNKFAWILLMDGSELTTGLLEKAVEIQPNGGIASLPLGVTLDLPKVLSGKTLDSMLNLALNIAGEGSKPTRLSLKLKPTILIAGQELEYPDYVTLSHEFNSGKNH